MADYLLAVFSGTAERWFLAGALLILASILARNFYWLIFIGASSIAVAAMIGHGSIAADDYKIQAYAFAFFSALWALLLGRVVRAFTRRILGKQGEEK